MATGHSKEKTCVICGKAFLPGSGIAKVCSSECREIKDHEYRIHRYQANLESMRAIGRERAAARRANDPEGERLKARLRKERDPEAYREMRRRSHKAHRPAKNAYQRRRLSLPGNREKHIAAVIRWQQENPEKHNAKNHRYRANQDNLDLFCLQILLQETTP